MSQAKGNCVLYRFSFDGCYAIFFTSVGWPWDHYSSLRLAINVGLKPGFLRNFPPWAWGYLTNISQAAPVIIPIMIRNSSFPNIPIRFLLGRGHLQSALWFPPLPHHCMSTYISSIVTYSNYENSCSVHYDITFVMCANLWAILCQTILSRTKPGVKSKMKM